MPPKTITLSDETIFSIKADLIKGYVEITFRSRLTLEFMKLRPELMDLAANGQLTEVQITPPPSLFDEITVRSGGREVVLSSSDTPLEIPI